MKNIDSATFYYGLPFFAIKWNLKNSNRGKKNEAIRKFEKFPFRTLFHIFYCLCIMDTKI